MLSERFQKKYIVLDASKIEYSRFHHTADKATDESLQRVKETGNTRYIVRIVRVVKRAVPPVVVTEVR